MRLNIKTKSRQGLLFFPFVVCVALFISCPNPINDVVTVSDSPPTTVSGSSPASLPNSGPVGTLSGKLWTSGNEAVGLVSIYLFTASATTSNPWDAQDITQTDAISGTYTFTGLTPGAYKVVAIYGDMVPTQIWYKSSTNSASASSLTLSSTQGLKDVDIVIDGSYISGSVLDSRGGTISNGSVSLTDSSGTVVGYANPGWGDGTWSIIGLKDGQYTITMKEQGFSHNGSSAVFFTESRSFTLAGGKSKTGINFVLNSGSISGTVRDGQGVTIPGTSIYVWDAINCYSCLQTSADNSGKYCVNGLPPGSYVIRFYNWDYPVNMYSGNAFNLSQASAYPITGAELVANVDGVLAKAVLSGTLTDNNASTKSKFTKGKAGLYDLASGQLLNTIISSASAFSCTYSFAGLADGNYKLRFDLIDSNGISYKTIWHGGTSLATATTVSIASQANNSVTETNN